jgi:hypothetical protein
VRQQPANQCAHILAGSSRTHDHAGQVFGVMKRLTGQELAAWGKHRVGVFAQGLQRPERFTRALHGRGNVGAGGNTPVGPQLRQQPGKPGLRVGPCGC